VGFCSLGFGDRLDDVAERINRIGATKSPLIEGEQEADDAPPAGSSKRRRARSRGGRAATSSRSASTSSGSSSLPTSPERSTRCSILTTPTSGISAPTERCSMTPPRTVSAPAITGWCSTSSKPWPTESSPEHLPRRRARRPSQRTRDHPLVGHGASPHGGRPRPALGRRRATLRGKVEPARAADRVPRTARGCVRL
jgi:hypothetical protein